MNFRPDIEGLRAIAIIPVVAFHAFPSILPGGYVGVDVFFVISGYLITSLLMQRLESNNYSIASFYAARIRRIFPALFFMLAVVVPAAYWFLSPPALIEFSRTLGATAMFLSNLELYKSTGYFDGATELKPLVHTWSLAVEEQYYVLFPIVLAILYKRWRAAIPIVIFFIGSISFVGSIWLVRNNPQLAFYSAASRTFELMLGSLLALIAFRKTSAKWIRESIAFLGLVLIAAACTLYKPDTAFPGLAALVPCLGTALIIWAGGLGQTVTGWLISNQILRWIGALSFSLYLWHWPVLVFTRHQILGNPSPLQTILAIFAAVMLSWISLRWIESPIRRRSSLSDQKLLWSGTGIIALTLLAAVSLTDAAKQRQQLKDLYNSYLKGISDINTERPRCHGKTNSSIPYSKRCVFGDHASSRHSAVWADSHGAELALALGEAVKPFGYAISQITSSSCPPALNFYLPQAPICEHHNTETLRSLVSDTTLDQVIIVARYNYYISINASSFESGLANSVSALTKAGKNVILIDPIPGYHYPIPAALALLWKRNDDISMLEQSVDTYRSDNKQALEILSNLSTQNNLPRISTEEIFCDTGKCSVLIDQKPLYFDDNHVTVTGARLIAKQILQFLISE